MTEILHVAGPDLTVYGRLRQRCSWCGAILVDVDLSRVAYLDSTPVERRSPGTWKVGVFVAVDDQVGLVSAHAVEPEPYPDADDAYKIPDGACMELDPVVTA